MAQAFKQVGVVGAGQMGSGIAQVLIQANMPVVLLDTDKQLLFQSVVNIGDRLQRQVDKEKMTQAQRSQALSLLVTTTDIAKLVRDTDLIIEAATEKIGIKRKIFADLDTAAPNHTILASNTSSLSITEIAGATNRPDRVIGMHFMNPVPVMKLVEIIRGLATSDETFERIRELTLSLNKTPVESKDYPGFIANRILLPMINEAIYALYEGVASIEDIDTTMQLGMNHPMGPLKLADFIGLDTCLFILERLHTGFGDSKYRPAPLLRQYVQAGWLGKKSGRGFYSY